MTPYNIDPYDAGGGDMIPLAQKRLRPFPKGIVIIESTPGKIYSTHVGDVIDKIAAAFGISADTLRVEVKKNERLKFADRFYDQSLGRMYSKPPLATEIGQKAWDAWWPVAAEEAKLCIRCGVRHADDGTHPCGH